MPRLARGLPQKQDGIKIVTKAPSGADGKAGDMRLLSTSNVEGAVLYVKSGNKWFPFQSGLDTSTPAKKLFEGNGYQTLDSGLIIQWGEQSSSYADWFNDSVHTVTFPLRFPTAVFKVMAGFETTTNLDGSVGISAMSTTGCSFRFDEWSSTVQNGKFVYIAIGH